jgi:hypothetical protein
MFTEIGKKEYMKYMCMEAEVSLLHNNIQRPVANLPQNYFVALKRFSTY